MKLFLAFILLISTTTFAQPDKDRQAVLDVLHHQNEAWNRGSIDDFMKGYWQSDSLMFIGKSGITYGYRNTLENYKQHYSNADQMGKLSFDILEVKRLSPDTYFVVGKWALKRNAGDVGGHYTLLFKKINKQWVIVADHSS